MSEIKRLLQAIHDDHMYCPDNKIVIEQTILGKKHKFFLPQDRQDQRQWQDEIAEVNRESNR